MNTEEILRTHLAKFGVPVELGTELRDFEHNEDSVVAHLIKHDGDRESQETVVCDYIIGSDGGRGDHSRHVF